MFVILQIVKLYHVNFHCALSNTYFLLRVLNLSERLKRCKLERREYSFVT